MHELIQTAHGINLLVSWVLNHKDMVGIVVGGSGVVSLVLEAVKKWIAVQSRTVITLLHYLLAVIAVALHYVGGSHSSSPVIVFLQALILLGTNQFVYPLFTKPLSGLLTDAKAKANVSKVVSEAEQLTNKTSSDYAG